MEQIKDMSETDKIMIFMEGLHLAIQAEVDYHMPDKLEEVMKMAINFDNAHFHSKPLVLKTNTKTSTKKEHVVYVSMHSKTSSDMTEPMDLDSIHKGKEHSRKKDGKPTPSDACYQCGKKGHITKNCRTKMPATTEKKAEINNIEGETKKNTECRTVIKELPESNSIDNEHEKLIRFDGVVNNKKAWILLDSSSALNFIDKLFIERH